LASGGYTKNGIWLSASSKSSNGFAELPPDLTNLDASFLAFVYIASIAILLI
jgi:hypothetical protein